MVVVTKTFAAPRVPGGVIAVIFCPFTTVKLLAAMPPMVTPVTLIKEEPLIVMVVPPAIGPAAGEILVTIGASTMLATSTSLPLLIAFVVTIAVRLPVVVGGGVKLTVNEVVVAEVTLPTAPLLKVTVLLAAMVSNPVPAMVRVVALIARLFVFEVTVGATVAAASKAPMLGAVVERVIPR